MNLCPDSTHSNVPRSMPLLLATMTTFPGAAVLVTAVYLNWQLMLVMLGCIPFIGASVGILTQMMSSTTQEGNDHYSKAGGVATEVGYVLSTRGITTDDDSRRQGIFSPLMVETVEAPPCSPRVSSSKV